MRAAGRLLQVGEQRFVDVGGDDARAFANEGFGGGAADALAGGGDEGGLAGEAIGHGGSPGFRKREVNAA